MKVEDRRPMPIEPHHRRLDKPPVDLRPGNESVDRSGSFEESFRLRWSQDNGVPGVGSQPSRDPREEIRREQQTRSSFDDLLKGSTHQRTFKTEISDGDEVTIEADRHRISSNEHSESEWQNALRNVNQTADADYVQDSSRIRSENFAHQTQAETSRIPTHAFRAPISPGEPASFIYFTNSPITLRA